MAAINNRLKNKIEGMISGWFPDWKQNMEWTESGRLLVRHPETTDELIYNLSLELGLPIERYKSTSRTHPDWDAELEIMW